MEKNFFCDNFFSVEILWTMTSDKWNLLWKFCIDVYLKVDKNYDLRVSL